MIIMDMIRMKGYFILQGSIQSAEKDLLWPSWLITVKQKQLNKSEREKKFLSPQTQGITFYFLSGLEEHKVYLHWR